MASRRELRSFHASIELNFENRRFLAHVPGLVLANDREDMDPVPRDFERDLVLFGIAGTLDSWHDRRIVGKSVVVPRDSRQVRWRRHLENNLGLGIPLVFLRMGRRKN